MAVTGMIRFVFPMRTDLIDPSLIRARVYVIPKLNASAVSSGVYAILGTDEDAGMGI